jgi:hypothetical protein
VKGKWFPSVVYLQNNVSPAWNKTNDDKPSLNQWGIKQETLLSQIAAYIKYIYQQKNKFNSCKLTIKKSNNYWKSSPKHVDNIPILKLKF